MKYRNLGKSGLKVSELSFGSWVTFNKQVDKNLAERMFGTCLEAGINFFDNAEGYERGMSEVVMGNALKSLNRSRDSYCVSSKVFFGSHDNPSPTQMGLSKKHITEAFWLAPSHAAQFAPLINVRRINEAMEKITLDLNKEFENQKSIGESKSLENIVGESPAFLIHFWSPFVNQSLAAMDEYFTFSTILIENKIPVASLLLSGTSEARRAGDDFLTKRAGPNTGFWLVDTEKSSLGSLMRVSSFPTVVLVSDKGKILFNGDPSDRRLWQTLKLLNPEITQPTIYAVQSKTDSKSTSPEKNGQ